MNNTRQTWIARLTSVALSAFITLSMFGGIDTLSQRDIAADSLMAQAAAQAAAKAS
jgi:cell division protein FtsB